MDIKTGKIYEFRMDKKKSTPAGSDQQEWKEFIKKVMDFGKESSMRKLRNDFMQDCCHAGAKSTELLSRILNTNFP